MGIHIIVILALVLVSGTVFLHDWYRNNKNRRYKEVAKAASSCGYVVIASEDDRNCYYIQHPYESSDPIDINLVWEKAVKLSSHRREIKLHVDRITVGNLSFTLKVSQHLDGR